MLLQPVSPQELQKPMENKTKTTRKPSKGLILNTFFIIKTILKIIELKNLSRKKKTMRFQTLQLKTTLLKLTLKKI